MVHLVEYRLRSGEVVLVQVADADGDAQVTRGRLFDAGAAVLERTEVYFEDAVASVRPMADALLGALTSLSRSPDEIGVEFGVEMTAGGSAFIATVGTTANFTVSLTWRRTDIAKAPAGPEGG